MTFPFTSAISALPATTPFVGPEATERATGRLFKARIGANESVFGPSPKAISAMQDALSETWKYSDPENHDLRHALAAHHRVKPDNVLIGEGIDGLLGLAVRLVVEPGTPVVMPDGAYPTFAFHVQGFGGALTRVPYSGDREDIDGMIDAAARTRAAIVYLTNPDNPMGTWWEASAINAVIDSLPERTALFLDEAYGEFAPQSALPAIDVSNPMVVRFRTFSKAYGMAGARIGYAIAHESVIAGFNKIRNQYGINRTGQIGALTALGDQAWLAGVVERVEAGRQRIYAIAADNGLEAIVSATNFVTIDCGRDQAFARSVLDGLIGRGIFVRMPFAAPGNRCIRVGVGLDSELDLLAEFLPEVLEQAAR